ncbi:uncharacterized protein LOC120843772 [Ixodes scapularis]|uniref:uncharacterized protein LOC120843772 n=1 Tax=Ixodes scapularis TaxID=6945 RepID=UPI001C394ECB|nr:uncharacterized protein LOC120843772 [Ixodes scapularis]
MSHVLIRWLNTGRTRLFDVVSIRDIVDTKIGALIIHNSKDPSVFATDVLIRWKGEKHPARIEAVGSAAQMEKRCQQITKNKEVKEASSNGASEDGDQLETCKHCEVLEVENNSLKSHMHELQEENNKLKTTIDYITSQKDGIEDLQTAASELLRFREELQQDRAARNFEKAEQSANACQQEDDEQVDLGGYKVNKAVIDMLQLGPAKTATTYARELLRQVFTTEELLGKSITGKQSNAHKEKEARPQLDPVRVNAVVKYTCKKFHLLKETTVRSSLSSMLNKTKESSPE